MKYATCKQKVILSDISQVSLFVLISFISINISHSHLSLNTVNILPLPFCLRFMLEARVSKYCHQIINLSRIQFCRQSLCHSISQKQRTSVVQKSIIAILTSNQISASRDLCCCRAN